MSRPESIAITRTPGSTAVRGIDDRSRDRDERVLRSERERQRDGEQSRHRSETRECREGTASEVRVHHGPDFLVEFHEHRHPDLDRIAIQQRRIELPLTHGIDGCASQRWRRRW